MAQERWKRDALTLKELLGLEYSPVAVSCLEGGAASSADKKLRICRALLDAGRGQVLKIDKANNACFGATWHLGFSKIRDPQVNQMVRKFVVEGEKLLSSYEALDRLMPQMEEPPDNSGNHFVLAPLEKAQVEPQLVIFIADAQASCRLLTLVTFIDGVMPKIKIGGPTCRMSIIYPLVAGEVNLSFFDYTARKICNVEKDKLLISVPYQRFTQIAASIDKCSAGTAKIEFPAEFRQFLQQRLSTGPVK